MKWISYLFGILLVLVLAVALLGPIGPVPGLLIGGTQTAAPGSWQNLPDEILFETKGGALPRVVTIWVIEDNNDLYVFGEKGSGWVTATRQAPQARVRIDEATYTLQVSEVNDISEALYQKYIDRYKADYPDIINGMPPFADVANTVAGYQLRR